MLKTEGAEEGEVLDTEAPSRRAQSWFKKLVRQEGAVNSE